MKFTQVSRLLNIIHKTAHKINSFVNMSTPATVEPHPLAANPDKCYIQLSKDGRYEKLEKLEPSKLYENPKNSESIRFVCISDTHNKTDNYHERIPDGDVLIHAGDFTATSADDEIVHFTNFLGKIAHKFTHVVVIAGNHEISFDPLTWNKGGPMVAAFKAWMGRNPLSGRSNPEKSKQLLSNCTYLENETIQLYGINIYGSPTTPTHHDLGFNKSRGEDILNEWNRIPNDTDILITHGPPLGIGDLCTSGYRAGCAELLSTVLDRVHPKFHVFGHIHEDAGVFKCGGTTFVNPASCDKKYRCVQDPVVFDYHIADEK